jgi:predicted aconitase
MVESPPVDDVELSGGDRALLDGSRGEAAAFAMRILLDLARARGAERLLDVTSVHVDGCLYHGQAGLDFAERLVEGGARVTVPTTLNVSSLDLLHPERFRGDAETAAAARRLMDAYEAMGCRPTWTCAPYQLLPRPGLGEHVAWAESNAIVFANSVLGARTERYGDFSDICAAITGRAPDVGLHRDEGRAGRVVFELRGVSDRLLGQDVLAVALGHLIGERTGARVPVIVGLPASTSEDHLKALGAAAASSGAVGLFHAIGVTPEAPTIEAALHGSPPEETVEVTPSMLREALDRLATAPDGPITAASVGTPHLSVAEMGRLVEVVREHPPSPAVVVYASTGRDVLAEGEGRGWPQALERAGVRLVTDTCTYITPILPAGDQVVMTNSGKWAYYAPGNIGVRVVVGTMEECVRSAELGRVWRDPGLWGG